VASSYLAKADDQSNTPDDPSTGVLQPMLTPDMLGDGAMAQLKANSYPLGDPSGTAYDRDWDDM
jgi:hypothetical protein